jgi:serine/threonine protein kinase
MKSQQWQKIEEVFHNAIAQSPSQRQDYLRQIQLEDPTLCKEVESLIAFSDEAQDAGFLNAPVVTTNNLWSIDKIIGQIIDEKYRIEKLLGQGGMGAVYLATHLGTGRLVAIKIIAPQFMGYKEFVERFKREAEATGRLRHPNVVNVTDFGFASMNSDKLAYLVMEYLNGTTLSKLIEEKKQLPLELIIDIVEQMCLAVEEAHKSGIIHRDLKPDNIWLEPNGRGGYNVKVLDFGLAKLRDIPSLQNTQLTLLEKLEIIKSAPSFINSLQNNATQQNFKSISENSTLYQINDGLSVANIDIKKDVVTHGNVSPETVPVWLTRAGMILGTPLYMSPEQCHGKTLDTSSDVYSIGVITYQMITGDTPFTGNLAELTAKHTNMPPIAIKEKRKDFPEAVSECVMTALAKNPADRPKSAIAFATTLKARSQGEISLIRQAISIYSNNFLSLLIASKIAYGPLILSLFLAILLPILPSISEKPFSAFGLLVSIPLSIFAMRFTNLTNATVIAPLVLQYIDNAKTPLSVSSIFNLLKRHRLTFIYHIVSLPIHIVVLGAIFWKLSYVNSIFTKSIISESSFYIFFVVGLMLLVIILSALFLSGSRFSRNSFLEIIQTLEGTKRQDAKSRATVLMNQVKYIKGYAGLILNMLLFDICFLSATLVWTLNKLFTSNLAPEEKVLAVCLGLFGLSITGSLAFLIAPLFSISHSLLYIQARQASGETLEEIVKQAKVILAK